MALILMLVAMCGLGLIVSDQLGRAAPPPMPVATTPPPEPITTPVGSSRDRMASPSPPRESTPPLSTNARPVRIDIAAIGVAAPLVAVGNAPDGTIGVPPPKKPYLAAWYKYSVTPGRPGRTVIVGHLDSRFSRSYTAVFYRLGALKRGEKVTVRRADDVVVEYVVDGASLQSKEEFPADQIYGKSERSELRLITCGGTYKKGTGWSSNIVVYGHMVSWHRTTNMERKAPIHHDTPPR